jgi:hypothetical protein
MLVAELTPTAAQEVLRLVQGLLQGLLGELAAGVDTRVAAIDGVFATLLNAPGHVGLIAQGLQAFSILPSPLLRFSAHQAIPLRWKRCVGSIAIWWRSPLAGRNCWIRRCQQRGGGQERLAHQPTLQYPRCHPCSPHYPQGWW